MKRIALFLLALSLLSPEGAQANVFSEIAGIFTDPLKLDKSTSNMLEAIERSSIYAERFEGQVNKDTQARIDQIGLIVRETRQDIDRTLDKTAASIDRISETTFQRVNVVQDTIFKNTASLVKCAVEVSADDVLGKLSSSLNSLGMRRPRLVVFGFTLMEARFDKSDFPSPIAGFREFKRLMDVRLGEIKPDDHPSTVVDIYGEIQRNADLTRCHYKADTALFEELNRYELEYNRRERYWTGIYRLE